MTRIPAFKTQNYPVWRESLPPSDRTPSKYDDIFVLVATDAETILIGQDHTFLSVYIGQENQMKTTDLLTIALFTNG